MFQHYLITRFNLKFDQWNTTKNSDALLDDSWMENRLELFENFCFPSVIAQNNKNFTWLLYLDQTTDPKFRRRLENLAANFPFIKIFYIDGMSVFLSSIKEYVAQNTTQPYLITTRLDNDDCVSVHYIDEIQKCFNQQDFQAIDILKGYSLQIEPQFILGKKEHFYNPFISLIEKNKAPQTVWLNSHTHWKKENRIQHITNKRLWLSIIHDKNKVNEFDGYGDINWNEIENEFKVSDTLNSKIKKEQLAFKDWNFKSLKNFISINFTYLSKVIKKSIGLYRIK